MKEVLIKHVSLLLLFIFMLIPLKYRAKLLWFLHGLKNKIKNRREE